MSLSITLDNVHGSKMGKNQKVIKVGKVNEKYDILTVEER